MSWNYLLTDMLDIVRPGRIAGGIRELIPLPKESALFYVVRQVPRRCDEYPITIAELPSVTRDLSRLLSEEKRNDLSDFLALDPGSGDVMPRTGVSERQDGHTWPEAKDLDFE